jgi:RHS repeat-associated protein
MKKINYCMMMLALMLSPIFSFGQCPNCFEGPTTVFSGQTAYYYWGGIPGGVWYITNATPGVIGTPSQSSDILSIPIVGAGGFTVTHDNAFGTQVNVIAWATPGPPDNPYVESTQCGRVTISMLTQNKPSDVDWYWIDRNGNFLSISPSIDVYADGTYFVQSRSHDHPEIIGGNSQPITVTMPQRPVDAVLRANNSAGPITVCAGEMFVISSTGGTGSPHYWASSNGGASWDVFADKHAGEDFFEFSTSNAGTYTFHVRNRTDVCGFCWDAGNACAESSIVNVTVLPAANPGELFLNNSNRDVCAGTRIPVELINNVGTAYYNIYYKKDTNGDGVLEIVSVEDAANLGTSFEYVLTEAGEWHFEYWSQTCGQNGAHLTSLISVWEPPSGPQFHGPDPLICKGDSTKIHVSPGYPATGVRWYESPTATNPLNNYPYTADFSTGPMYQSKSFWVASYIAFSPTAGCEGARYEYYVTVSDRPVDSEISASATSICVGESVRITASGGVGTTHFYCSSDGGSSWNVFNDFNAGAMQFDHTPNEPGTYKYSVRNSTACGYCGESGNNCSSEKFVTVVVNPRPTAGNIVGQKNVLFGQPYNYSLPDATIGASDFTWQVSGGTLVSGQGTENVKASFTQAGGQISAIVANGRCASQNIPSLTVGEGGNYVTDETTLVGGIKDPMMIRTLDENSKTKSTAFVDGLGRQLQSVNWRSSPQKNDIVTVNVYDVHGREPVKYLPFTGSGDGYFKPDPIGSTQNSYADSPQHAFYDGRILNVASDNNPNIKTVFEFSPLNRVLKLGAAGTSWQPDSTGRDDHAVEKKYVVNGSGEVYKFIYNVSTGILSWTALGGFYSANELLSNITIDEHNNESAEYLDKMGRIVCKKVQYSTVNGIKQYASTYYLYDAFGNLVVVLPPEATRQITATATQTLKPAKLPTAIANIIDKYCFRYKYDSRRRMTHKKVPGGDWVYMVYDDRDRLVLTQDGNQRSTTPGYWTFTKYDHLNRPILTGIRDTTDISQELMQTVVNNFYAKPSSRWFEHYVGNVISNVHGYSNKSYPVCTGSVASEVDVNKFLTAIYYDNYEFSSAWQGDYAYRNETLSETVNGIYYRQRENAFRQVVGQITGTKLKVLDGGVTGGYTWLKSISYYDDKYRVIQTLGDNYKGGMNLTSYLLDFAGRILKSKATHVERDPAWKSLVGVALLGNKLYKNTTALEKWGNGGAVSVQLLQPGQDGWLEFITTETSTSRVLGLSATNPDANYMSIDYAFHQAPGELVILEKGIPKKMLGAYVPGEVLRIERKNATVIYVRNGMAIDSSSVSSTGSLIVDAAFFSNGATLAAMTASFTTTSHIVTQGYEYDHAGRLVIVRHQVDSNPEIVLVRNEYNELGQLIDKKLHTPTIGSKFKQSVDYRYNIRGWLKSINNSLLHNDGGVTNDDSDDFFGMELGYDNDLTTGNKALYNGNIGGTKWSFNMTLGSLKNVAYNYTYDPLGRILSADYLGQHSDSWTNSRKSFNENNYDYDLNGNIVSLTRRDRTGNIIDELKYDYGTGGGNQLMKVSDAGDKTAGFIEPAATTGNDYVYDASGNMTRDKNKGVAITYNIFNLPEVVSKGGQRLYYSYDATGRKLAQDVIAGKLRKATRYVNEYVYENDTLKFINHDEGRVVIAGKTVAATQLLTFSDCNNVSDFIQYGNASLTISNYTNAAGDTYVKMVSNVNSASSPGMVSKLVDVTPGQRYQLRMRAYCPSDNAYIYVQSQAGGNVVWSGDVLPSLEEGWVSREFAVPASVSKIRVGVRFNHVTKGNAVYLNTIEMYAYDPKHGSVETKSFVDYQYHIKDHLGNVRLTFTTSPDVQIDKATMETELRAGESGVFLRYDNAKRVHSSLFDHTNGNISGWSQRLNGSANEKYGLARSLSVMPGDSVRIDVYAKYVDPERSNWTPPLTSLLALISSGASTITKDGTAYSSGGSAFPYGDWFGTGVNPWGPRAYLSWLIFDGKDSLIDFGHRMMTTAAREYGQDAPHERLSSSTFLIREPGHVFAWYSNEESTPVDVYFDDFTIRHIKGPVIQQQDYYPFGLTFNSYSREDAVEQRYKYNGMEEVNDLGLNILFPSKYRTYDPAIARFMQVDPVPKEHESPYSWNTNNPILFADPTGADSTQRANAVAKAREYVNKNPGDSYPTKAEKEAGNFKGAPGEKVDCSGLVSKAIIAGGEADPVAKGTGRGVERIAKNLPKVGDKNDMSQVEVGTVVALNNTGKGEIKSENDFKHTGIISEIVRNADGEITTMKMIDSGGTAGSGASGPRVSDLIVNGKSEYWGNRINGFYKWDTKPDTQ